MKVRIFTNSLNIRRVRNQNDMISKAINLAKHHKIHLKRGEKIPPDGDCAFAAVISNITKRSCFHEELKDPIHHYRKQWISQFEDSESPFIPYQDLWYM